MRFYITSKPEGMKPVYNLFVKALDTDFVYTLFPEILKNANTGYTNISTSCMMRLSVSDNPSLRMRDTFISYDSQLKIDILCVKNNNNTNTTLNSSA